jgi:hypothetical protein
MSSWIIFLTLTGFVALTHALYLTFLNWKRSRSTSTANFTTARDVHNLRIAPLACTFLASLGSILISIKSRNTAAVCAEANEAINLDVGGIGVLLGLLFPCLMLLIVLISGHFMPETSGAKELCIAQCASTSRGAI